jgi:diguanylate cyclase (GGDEF)-like protein
VNDALGHAAGDQLLIEVTARLRACLARAGRAADVLARLGGDEFVLLLRDLPCDASAVVDELAEQVLQSLAEPVRLDGRTFEVTASIGIVLPEPGATASEHEVLRSADAAMYQAKANGRARWTTYDAELDRSLRERFELESDLRGAIEREQFEVHYQPVVDVAGELLGVEALVRWRHPSRGLVPPLDFIPLAEDLGLIGALGSWVLRTACRQAADWNARRRDRGLSPLTLAVNISPAQIDAGLDDEVLAVLAETGLQPDRLLLEVTETDYMQPDGSAPQVLTGLRARGVRIAIDDFGTGFSSFDRLRRFPVDVLKIDRSFVTALDGGPAAVAIITAMLSLSTALGSYVVAEGVELPEQASALYEAGCRHFQGWLYAPARPAADLTEQVLPASASHLVPRARPSGEGVATTV